MQSLAVQPLSPPSACRLALVGIAFSLLWSSAFVAGKIGLAVAAPLTLLSLRFLLAGVLLLIGLRLSGFRVGLPPRAALLAGVLTNTVYLGLTYSGMARVPAALTAILVCTSPLFTTIMAALWQGERLTVRTISGLLLAFASVIAIMAQRLQLDHVDPWAVAAIVAGSLALALGTLLNRKVVGGIDPRSLATTQLLASGLALLPLAIIGEHLRFEAGPAFYGSLLYQAGPVSIGTTLMLLWLIRHGGAGKASSFHLLNPFFSIALAIAFLGESARSFDLFCLLPLVAGMALVLRRPAG